MADPTDKMENIINLCKRRKKRTKKTYQ